MSWELLSFLILGALLLAGFAWYERSRPPAQVVALVAALAALAIAGRVAFAAFPNVKPTTDIVVFAGYALGPAGGFAVGGLTALVSNIWFGQGPWTPWQMAGWGLCGLLGAGLALGTRNVGRLTLAAVCGFAGIAYGALLNFSLMATYGGDLTFEHFLVLEGRAIPFDAAHAIGNITFALIAGPAMIRMLVRFRERFEWRRTTVAAGLLVALAIAVSVLPAAARADSSQAVSWLISVQEPDGGFGSSPKSGSDVTQTTWAMLALEAAGKNPRDVSRGGKTPIDYLRSRVSGVKSAGDYARAILAVQGSGLDPREFGGKNLVSELQGQQAQNGSWQGWPGVTSYAIVALRSAGAGARLGDAQAWLIEAQNDDGGWGNARNSGSVPDITGAALQAIPDTKAARRGLSFLNNHQRKNGGFSIPGGAVNTQSTAWAAQGVIATGGNPSEALSYMDGMQDADGHYRYSSASDITPVFVTSQVLIPASGSSLPVPVPPRAPMPKPAPRTTRGAPPATPPTQVPIPGVESLPGTGSGPSVPTVPATPPGSSGIGESSTGGSGPLVPESSTAIPPATGTPAPEGEEGSGLTRATPASSIEEGGSGTSPWVPIGIGLGITALAVALPLLLGRRYAW
jgi:energy-coupling factor transport system substrate-specific component